MPDGGPEEEKEWHRNHAFYDERVDGPLEDLETYVDGALVESQMQFGYVYENQNVPYAWLPADSLTGRRVGWHLVELTFPPGGRVTLERRYTAWNGKDGLIGEHFYYITLTGGPWQGAIGKLTAKVVLEDELTVEVLHWNPQGKIMGPARCMPPRQDWIIESPQQLSLIWSNFEPMQDATKHEIILLWRPKEPKDCPYGLWKGVLKPVSSRELEPLRMWCLADGILEPDELSRVIRRLFWYNAYQFDTGDPHFVPQGEDYRVLDVSVDDVDGHMGVVLWQKTGKEYYFRFDPELNGATISEY
jgi:hypothetical protein